MENENKLFLNQEMKPEEIDEAITLLNEALKRNIFTYEHANPIKENCYISSGYISGLYFPNTTLLLNSERVYNAHKNYNFSCIAKIDYKLCFVYSLKDEINPVFKSLKLKPFIYDEIESVLYSYEERQIKSKLEARLKEHNKRLQDLQKITRSKTKTGEDFKILNKSFNNCVITINHNLYDSKITGFKINYDYYIYFKDEKESINADIIEAEIKKAIEQEKKSINNTKTALKKLFSNYTKMLKIKDNCKAFFNSLENGENYIFKEVFKSMI